MSDFIKDVWDKQAEANKLSHCASWGDNLAIQLEIDTIEKHIKKGETVLDIGCANGYSTYAQFQKKPIKITGVDFSEAMIKYAKERKNSLKLGDSIQFEVGDIRKLRFMDNSFDIVYTTRVLINLPNWEEQKLGISECLRVAKSGGVVIFSEAFWEPLVLLNALRQLKNLPALVEHDFNRYLKKNKLESFLKDQQLKFHCEEFSSVYYLGSRFLRELVTNPADYPGYSNPINKLFFEIEKEFSGGGFGIQQAYIINKTN